MKVLEVSGKIMRENEEGALAPRKILLLIEAETFTEGETVAMQWLNSYTMFPEHTEVISIKRCDYAGIQYNENLTVDEDKLLSLSEYVPTDEECKFQELVVQFEEITEAGKPKYTKEKYIVPADGQIEAIQKVDSSMSGITIPYKIVNTKETAIYAALVKNDTYKIAKREFEN